MAYSVVENIVLQKLDGPIVAYQLVPVSHEYILEENGVLRQLNKASSNAFKRILRKLPKQFGFFWHGWCGLHGLSDRKSSSESV